MEEKRDLDITVGDWVDRDRSSIVFAVKRSFGKGGDSRWIQPREGGLRIFLKIILIIPT